MIDDMEFHLTVWNDILNNELNAGLTKDAVKTHMYGKNVEVLDRIFGKNHFTPNEVDVISRRKEERYQEIYKPHLKLLPGLSEFLATAKSRNIAMAIGSAAIPFNIDFVLDNLSIRHYFPVVVSSDDVIDSKPHPETYLKAANLLSVEPESCVVFEDVPKGVEAALNAGMKCVVVTGMHHADEFSQYPNIVLFIKDYNDPRLLLL